MTKPVFKGDILDGGKAFREAQAWIDAQSNSFIPFCSNIMRDRGHVYWCRIRDGRAVCEMKQSWWAMSYTERVICEAEDLGAVVPTRLSGSTNVTIGIQNGKGYITLRYGEG